MRPHDALDGMRRPLQALRPQAPGAGPFAYPRAFLVRRVDRTGHVSCHGDKPYAGLALRGQRVGFERLEGLRGWGRVFSMTSPSQDRRCPNGSTGPPSKTPRPPLVIDEKKLNESTETAA